MIGHLAAFKGRQAIWAAKEGNLRTCFCQLIHTFLTQLVRKVCIGGFNRAAAAGGPLARAEWIFVAYVHGIQNVAEFVNNVHFTCHTAGIVNGYEATVEVLWQEMTLFVYHLHKGLDFNIWKIAILWVNNGEHFSGVRRHTYHCFCTALVQEGRYTLGIFAQGFFKAKFVQEGARINFCFAIVANIVTQGF